MVFIKIIDQEDDLHVFEVHIEDVILLMDCYVLVQDEHLSLLSLNVDGPGSNHFGERISKVINTICKAFCEMYKTKEITIIGAKRGAGKTKGTFLKPIYRRFDDLEK